jgi:hypothetical protein
MSAFHIMIAQAGLQIALTLLIAFLISVPAAGIDRTARFNIIAM